MKRGGGETTAVWGELDTTKVTRLGDGGPTRCDDLGTVARDVDGEYMSLVFYVEHFFVSDRVPDDRLISVISRHNPPPILLSSNRTNTTTPLHGWTLLLSVFNLPSTNITVLVSS
ncbi:hypothetical protein PISMIDRAFT_11072 [Pisolithus microcarpus 441]|uniref:Uncharacterized protein n=1 Tax=Pisolithus microcarpus 441 TaxID=765257 RepID=A0A0C9ZLB1_9AGAM|nr:hypothetical protein PISMIDRAFT_11072 [Pisolithus microcarpus 441]